ncbi:hypothetical protein FGO68_gene17477 [Halteria grandinella]|uniref:Uncharacterized protein n=1 Tax=Halteria grandinella TaxID=5974 RepID=A0A8J8NJV9_HALGN|nr:hypothetical protein FGO68_gene17477 [Halteria grandinella]
MAYRSHLIKHFTAIKSISGEYCKCRYEKISFYSNGLCDLSKCKGCNQWHASASYFAQGFCIECNKCHRCCNRLYSCDKCINADPLSCSQFKCQSCAIAKAPTDNIYPSYNCESCGRTHKCYTCYGESYCEDCDECHQLFGKCEIFPGASSKFQSSRGKPAWEEFDKFMWELQWMHEAHEDGQNQVVEIEAEEEVQGESNQQK